MKFRKVDLRQVWTEVLLACLFGGIKPGAPASSSSTSTTTTGPTTTTTTGPTTTMGPTTTTTESPMSLATKYGAKVYLKGITKTQFDTVVADFKTVWTSACNTYCLTSGTTARVCCDATMTYSPTVSMVYIVSNNVIVAQTVALTSDTMYLDFLLMSDSSNTLCSSGSRRKRAITNGYVTAATLVTIFANVKTQFETAFSAAATTTLGTSVTVTVTSVGYSHSSSVKASGLIMSLMVLVSALVVMDFDWSSNSAEKKQAPKEDEVIAELRERQLIKPMEALDTDGLITTY